MQELKAGHSHTSIALTTFTISMRLRNNLLTRSLALLIFLDFLGLKFSEQTRGECTFGQFVHKRVDWRSFAEREMRNCVRGKEKVK